MKRPRIKKVASRVPENVTGNGLAFALDQHHQIEKHDVAEPQKAFSESEETNEEIEKYRVEREKQFKDFEGKVRTSSSSHGVKI